MQSRVSPGASSTRVPVEVLPATASGRGAARATSTGSVPADARTSPTSAAGTTGATGAASSGERAMIAPTAACTTLTMTSRPGASQLWQTEWKAAAGR